MKASARKKKAPLPDYPQLACAPYYAYAGTVIILPSGKKYRVTLDWKKRNGAWRFVEIKDKLNS